MSLSSRKEKLNDYNTGHSTRITVDSLKIDIGKLMSLNKIIRLGKYTFGFWSMMYNVLDPTIIMCNPKAISFS